ncbi:hypothetical protein F4776DRAFT_605520 [Hypoxylon sp. NC0597]|nr:hypothetical protein F4776DRAFT_605520 [Hypoxylon sp. NC0597]
MSLLQIYLVLIPYCLKHYAQGWPRPRIRIFYTTQYRRRRCELRAKSRGIRTTCPLLPRYLVNGVVGQARIHVQNRGTASV